MKSRYKESKPEKIIRKWLVNNNIEFIQEKTFDGCKNKAPLRFDFYIPKFNTCIEYDGKHHFKPMMFGFYYGPNTDDKIKARFESTKINDNIKNNFCKENNINLIRMACPFAKIKHILKKLFNKLID